MSPALPIVRTKIVATMADLIDVQKQAEPAPAPAVAPELMTDKPKRGRKPKAEADVAQVTHFEEPEAPADPEPVEVKTGQEWQAAAVEPQVEAQPEAPKTITLDDVRGALQAFTAQKGVPAGIELLKKFGAGRISELAQENYAAFVQACAA